jgi:hypothetical protein
MTEQVSRKLEDLLASKFIQRRDVKSQQTHNGAYYPVTEGRDGPYIPWSRDDLTDHLTGKKSYGHYLVDKDGNAKLFAFDIDLTKWSEKSGRVAPAWLAIDEEGFTVTGEPKPLQPREAWNHPKAPPELRRFLISQLRGIAEKLATVTLDVLNVPVAVSYSGGKGLHVYGLTGTAPAQDLRSAAMEVISFAGCFEPLRGKNFYRHVDESPRTGFPCIDVEVFPKQDDLDGKDLGNLMRLPLGTHAKSRQEAYFLDLSSPIDELKVAEPVPALERGNPWLQ